MSITPAGKTRVMVAQTFANPLSEGYAQAPSVEKRQDTISFDTDKAMEEEVGSPSMSTMEQEGNSSISSPIGGEQNTSPKEKKKTLTNYVFEKLKSYGYPGRRLEEFKSKFVKESVSPQGVKDIQIEIPDRKYPGADGIADTIENSDLKEIAREIQESFGLNFNGADRSDGKWTIKFTSEKLANPDEQESVADSLEQVYGSPSGKGDGSKGQVFKGKQKAAGWTMQEMIKASKNDVIKQLEKISGD